MTTPRTPDAVRKIVRDHYGAIAARPAASACCTPGGSAALGYTSDQLAAVPEGTDLGLGCGNPHAIAALEPGQTVLDLGSGPGFDCFLAARAVGPTGHVIGVDMTPAMISRARAAAAEAGLSQVEFRLGEIEHLPVADASVDVILSNCVINLSPDKGAVFRDALRALRPGGRLAISDMVQLQPLPAGLQDNLLALAGCVAGAATLDALEAHLHEAGFVDVAVTVRPESRAVIASWLPGSGAEDYVASAEIQARRPALGEAVGAPAARRAEPAPAAASCCAPSCCGGAA